MPELVIRAASEADSDVMAALIRAAFAEYAGRLVPASSAHGESPETVARKLARGGGALAFRESEPIGCVVFDASEDGVLTLSRLSVLPQHRDRGVGRALVEHVERTAGALGRSRVRLGVRVALLEIRAWYERLGYRPSGFGTHDGFAEPTFDLLEKPLEGALPERSEARG